MTRALYALEAAAAGVILAVAGVQLVRLGGWLWVEPWWAIPLAAPAGVCWRLVRFRHPLSGVKRWHGAAVRRLDGRG